MYVRIIEKIINERDSKRYVQVLQACEGIIQEIKAAAADEEQQVSSNINNNNRSEEFEKKEERNEEKFNIDSEKCFVPLELACLGDSPKMTVIALDGIQKLIAHGHLKGDFPNSTNPSKRLIDRIVETICSCYNGAEYTDEGVELQIIKALLTIVTSQSVQIHEGTVLLTLRTCFNIYLTSKNTINQTTSRAMLTQMLHSIFTRMEISFGKNSRDFDKNEDGVCADMVEIVSTSLKNWASESISWFFEWDISSLCDRRDGEALSVLCEAEEVTEKAREEQRVQDDEHHPNTCKSQKISNENTPKNELRWEILQKDAFLVLWAVCKLATKPATDNSDSETRSKVLAFQLVKSVLENSGPAFQKSSVLLTAVQQHLCEVMLATGATSVQEIYQLNVDLLLILVSKFRNVIMGDINKLFEGILFPVLEQSDSQPSEYKILALGTINRVFKNFKALCDIFLKHDCKKSDDNGVFQRMIGYVCQFAYSEKVFVETGSMGSLPIRIFAIETVTMLLQKMSQCIEKKCDEHSSTIANAETINKCAFNVSCQDVDNFSEEFVFVLTEFITNISEDINVVEIDVTIQKMAQSLYEKYSPSKETFESSDAIYMLFYASIALVGELSSNNQGKGRGCKETFVKTHRGSISWSQGLSDKLIEQVYDEIEEFLKLQSNRQNLQNSNDKDIKISHNATRIVTLLGQQPFFVIHEKQAKCIRKMFKATGKSLLNVLIGTLISCDDTTVTDMCLDGIKTSIHITSILNLKKERDAFVQSLSRLSLSALKEIIGKTANPLVVKSKTSSTTTTVNGITKTTTTTTTETKCRNVDIIQTLLNVANNEGNQLGNSWLDTLKCISQLEANDLMGKSSTSRNPSSPISENTERTSWYSWAGSLIPSFWDGSNANKLDLASIKESMDSNVSRVFTNSTKLNEDGIVEFFKALCQVSLIEITHPEQPRSFVYEKIFEVAFINMDRPCFEWCNIWQVLSDYFCHLACSSDEDISYFAIDSISKLAFHLLDKETFGDFRFQSHFLKPYETILQNTPFVSTRAYVLESVAKLGRSSYTKLRSGWIPIFRILESSIYQDDDSTAEASFILMKGILNLFSSEQADIGNSYLEILRCVIGLSFKSHSSTIRVESLHIIQDIATLIHSKPNIFMSAEDAQNRSRFWNKTWLPLFIELARVVGEADTLEYTEVDQASSLQILFDIIKQYGDQFNTDWWYSLFQLIFGIFRSIKNRRKDAVDSTATSTHPPSKNGYSKYYCYYYVQFAIVDTFVRQYDKIGEQLLQDVLNELKWCIKQEHEQISLSGVQCLHSVVRMLESKFKAENWTWIVQTVGNLLDNAISMRPNDSQSLESYQWNPVVQLEILKIVKTILDGASTREKKLSEVMKQDQLLLLDALEQRMKISHQLFSLKTIQDPDICSTIHLQETLLIEIYLNFILDMYFHQTWSNDEFHTIEVRFTNGVVNVLSYFLIMQPTKSSSVSSLNPILTTLIQSIHKELPQDKFQKFASILYPKLCDLLELDLEASLSTALAKYFLSVIRSKVGDSKEDLQNALNIKN